MSDQRVLDVLSVETVETMFDSGAVRRYSKGSWLFHEGDPAERVWVITAGVVKVQKVSEGGRVSVLGFRESGCLLGEQSALDGEPMIAGALALADTEAVVIARPTFLDIVADRGDLAMALLQQMNQRLRQSARLLHDLATADAVTRVANRIIDLTEARDDESAPAQMGVPVSQQDLAEWAGLSREATVRALRLLRDEGIISTARMSVTVLDRGALTARGQAFGSV